MAEWFNKAPDFKSGDPKFGSYTLATMQLGFFQVVPGSTPQLHSQLRAASWDS